MKLTENLHLLQIDFEIALSPDKKLPRFVNVLIILGDKITLIDTGVKGSEQKIVDYIRSINRNASEIGTVILSHSHPDHIGCAARIKEITGCKVMAHAAEREWIENIEVQMQQRPVPGFLNLVDRNVVIDEFIPDHQEIKIKQNCTLRFIHAPGHSAGSLNILFKEDRILFTADSVPLKNDIPNYDNYRDLMQSLEAIRNNDQYDMLLTSWTPPVRNKTAISRLLEEGEEYMRSVDRAVKSCYKGKTDEFPVSCQCAVEKLGLPAFMANPIVDRAFKSNF
ncbi:MAG TPA: MBL fold metallo-hydrolase [Bacteroidales bacterium]|nr:MBL fold metallo-hydrolase [Bacteroidales bacterium]